MLPPSSPAPSAPAPARPAPHGHAADSTLAQTAALAFIERWRHVAASELATAQTFVTELCALLGVPAPDPAGDGSYTFEKPVTFHHGNGSTSAGRIDCYRRGAFVLKAQKLRARTGTFDAAMLRARQQAEDYARALPPEEGRPVQKEANPGGASRARRADRSEAGGASRDRLADGIAVVEDFSR